jgi:RNA polymerase sigma-70 factor (ECF subfamily)
VVGPSSDEALMQQVAQGDTRAFATLFDRHQRGVARFAHRFVGSRARAEELTQDIFMKLYRSARSYTPTATFKTFLYRVATNHCLNELRRGEYRYEETPPEGDDERLNVPGPGGERPDETFAGRELERAVGRALGNLSERERIAFTLCRFEGMAYREIAEALSATEAAVKSLIHRATLGMARQLEPILGTPPAGRSEA